MSFFRKLRERLTRSSSKIDEGLDAIIDEAPVLDSAEDAGPEGEGEAPPPAPGGTGAASAAPAAALPSTPSGVVAATGQADGMLDRQAPDPDAARSDDMARGERPWGSVAEPAAPGGNAAAARERSGFLGRMLGRGATSDAPGGGDAVPRPDETTVPIPPGPPEPDDPLTSGNRAANETEPRAAGTQPGAPVRPAAEQRVPPVAAPPRAEESQDPERSRTGPSARADPALRREVSLEALDSDAEEERPGLFGRMLGRKAVKRRILDDAMLESLEELLITADLGVDTALRLSANLAEGNFGRRFSSDELKTLLADQIAAVLEPVARPLPLYARRPQVVLVVGVNGSGKTTTIGKLAAQFRDAGKSVMIAAGDTFRAAAVEQLQIWGERAGVPVLTAAQGSDPASLAYDAMARAEAEGCDLLLIDTAGRLQNRGDLMEELAKIVRVIRKRDPDAPHNTVLVLDATTGQNALSQVEIFQKIADVSGLVMTKLDGTAKGGVLVALADRFGLPIHAIGVGEQIDDLSPFDPRDFAEALTGAGGR